MSLGILDMLFPGHKDDPFFIEVCEDLDTVKNSLSLEERFEVYKQCLDYFHRLTRSYTAWWNALRHGIRVDNTSPETSLFTLVITAFSLKRWEKTLPEEIAEGNLSLHLLVNDERKAQASNVIMTAMLAQLHMSIPARLAS